jgi:hypothetical protein
MAGSFYWKDFGNTDLCETSRKRDPFEGDGLDLRKKTTTKRNNAGQHQPRR